MAETVIGTRTKLELVSQSHGIIKVPLAQSFDYTPRFTERTIFEFDRSEAALVVSTFDGVDVRFDYFDSDSKLVDATINDLDPGSTLTVHDPSTMKEIQAVLNVRGEDGVIFQSILAHGMRVKGIAAAEPVREESRITVDGAAQNVRRVKGGAILYSRMLASAPAVSVYDQAIPPNSDVDQNFPLLTPWEVTLDEPTEEVDTAGTRYLLVLKNGDEVTTGFTVTTTKFTLPSAPAVTDVWEAFTVYID